MINDLINETERSRSIVRNLLDFARESESISEPLDLGALVHDTYKLTFNQIKVSGCNKSIYRSSRIFPKSGATSRN